MQADRNTESRIAIEVVRTNGLRPIKPAQFSTGLRTHVDRYDGLRTGAGTRVAEEFLINSRLRRGDAELGLSIKNYTTDPAVAILSRIGHESRLGSLAVALPDSVRLEMNLGEAIQKRRSVRQYSGDAVSLAHLATIIRAACGITHISTEQDGVAGLRLRSTPSGGALYPVALHVAALHVESLPRGFYLYDPLHDQLWQTGEAGKVDELLQTLALPGQVITERKASAVFLLVGRPWRSMRKYGARGMRNLFLEAGAMAEHINLTAVALKLGSVDCGSFYDDETHEVLEADGLYEALVHAIFLGVPD